MLERIKIDNREDWLRERFFGIGASESGAVLGLSSFMSATDLWKIKTGKAKPKDLSDNDVVAMGVRFEPAIREMFKAAHPEWTVEHYPYDILYQEGRRWQFATLDGEIYTEDGKAGILEIKTSSPVGRAAWQKWDNQIPQGYYCQLLHQLTASGISFAILYAALFSQNGQITLREYYFDAENLQGDMEYLTAEEEKFWGCVQRNELPATKLVL